MKIFRTNSAVFIIPVFVSLILHLVALSGIPAFGEFPASGISQIILTSLEEEAPKPGRVAEEKSIPVVEKEILMDSSLFAGEPELQAEDQPSEISVPEKSMPEQDIAGAKNETPVETAPVAAGAEPERSTAEQATREIAEDKVERLGMNFDIHWLGMYVGTAKLEIEKNDGTVRLKSEVHSNDFISSFYKVEDYSECVITDNMPVSFKIKQHEGKYRSDKETIFDRENNKVIYTNHRKGTRNEHPLTDPDLRDLLSGFQYLRTQPLEIGKTVFIDVFDSNKFYTVEVDILKRESIELADKTRIDTVKVKPALRSEGLFQKKGEILIWLSDDENRIPVKVETKVSIGKVVASLSGLYEGAGTGPLP